MNYLFAKEVKWFGLKKHIGIYRQTVVSRINMNQPKHALPSYLYPDWKHRQSYDPAVLTQCVMAGHLCRPFTHSSTSVEWNDSVSTILSVSSYELNDNSNFDEWLLQKLIAVVFFWQHVKCKRSVRGNAFYFLHRRNWLICARGSTLIGSKVLPWFCMALSNVYNLVRNATRS